MITPRFCLGTIILTSKFAVHGKQNQKSIIQQIFISEEYAAIYKTMNIFQKVLTAVLKIKINKVV